MSDFNGDGAEDLAVANDLSKNVSVLINTFFLTRLRTVAIDIKPGSSENPIDLKSRGKIPVAVLSTSEFVAPDRVDNMSLTFGRTGDEPSLVFCHSEDVNGDGLPDLICHFDAQISGFQPGDSLGVLKGRTLDRVSITGKDSVRIVSR